MMRRWWLWWGITAVCFLTISSLALAQSEPTPTPDRLAAPPTVPSPTQADEGAQLYWLHCQPCHGDQGQGLTDEWRAQYPPEDQNCWNSGCHGVRPYEDGFTLPPHVPAVIGEDSLARFASMGQVYQYMRAAMPFQAAGSLTQAEYLAITAYLAQAHNVWAGVVFDETTVHEARLKPVEPTIVVSAVATPTKTDSSVVIVTHVNDGRLIVSIIVITLLIAGGVWLWYQQKV